MDPRCVAGRVFALGGLLLCLTVPVWAQTRLLTWDMTSETQAQAQGYRYELFVDNATAGAVVPATCTGSAPVVCTTPLPALTPGTHTLALEAIEPVNGLRSGRSQPFSLAVPSVPGALGVR